PETVRAVSATVLFHLLVRSNESQGSELHWGVQHSMVESFPHGDIDLAQYAAESEGRVCEYSGRRETPDPVGKRSETVSTVEVMEWWSTGVVSPECITPLL